ARPALYSSNAGRRNMNDSPRVTLSRPLRKTATHPGGLPLPALPSLPYTPSRPRARIPVLVQGRVMRRLSFRCKALLGGLVLLLTVAAVAWYERVPLLTGLCVRALARAGAAERHACADRVVGLGDAAGPGGVGRLPRGAPRLCGGAPGAPAR